MSVLLQQIMVAIVVLGCALFSAWRLASHRLRLRALSQARERGTCAQGATPDAASRNRTPGALRR
jgi:hypothetical protein